MRARRCRDAPIRASTLRARRCVLGANSAPTDSRQPAALRAPRPACSCTRRASWRANEAGPPCPVLSPTRPAPLTSIPVPAATPFPPSRPIADGIPPRPMSRPAPNSVYWWRVDALVPLIMPLRHLPCLRIATYLHIVVGAAAAADACPASPAPSPLHLRLMFSVSS